MRSTIDPAATPASALLALDCSTERISVALCVGERAWTHEGAGGAGASGTLLASIFALLAQARISVHRLDAIAFGRGPGAFTGVRTACSVVQGLGLGADKPVLPLDTLLAVAEDARKSCACADVIAEHRR